MVKVKLVKAKRAKRRVCEYKGCRKSALPGGVFCQKHLEENDGPERVVKMKEVEALRFGKMDAEIRNAVQGIKLLDYEVENEKIRYRAALQSMLSRRAQLEARLEALKGEYDPLIADLAASYGIDDASRMTIDPDSGTIRDVKE